MKSTKLLSLLLALCLALSLAACAGSNQPSESGADLSSYADTYTFLCAIMEGGAGLPEGVSVDPASLEPQFVAPEQMTGWTVTLQEDGAGSLYWGENNQGPISKWSVQGDVISLSAGVSNMTGTLRDGLLTLDMGEGLTVLFAGPKADTSTIHPLTTEEYIDYVLQHAGAASSSP